MQGAWDDSTALGCQECRHSAPVPYGAFVGEVAELRHHAGRASHPLLVCTVSYARVYFGPFPFPLKHGSLSFRGTAFLLIAPQTVETKLRMCFVLQRTRTFPEHNPLRLDSVTP